MHGVDLFYKLFINLLSVNKMVNAIFVSVCCTLIRYMALFIFILAFPAICLCVQNGSRLSVEKGKMTFISQLRIRLYVRITLINQIYLQILTDIDWQKQLLLNYRYI